MCMVQDYGKEAPNFDIVEVRVAVLSVMVEAKKFCAEAVYRISDAGTWMRLWGAEALAFVMKSCDGLGANLHLEEARADSRARVRELDCGRVRWFRSGDRGGEEGTGWERGEVGRRGGCGSGLPPAPAAAH